MKNQESSRPYRMRARAESAARTTRAIVAAMAGLWRERSLDEITLEMVAARAGVSTRTVIRRFGSREGVIAATIQSEGTRISEERNRAEVGDLEGALDVLLAHYERDGLAVLRTLALEGRVPEAKVVVETGRVAHRAWCARIFASYLPPPGSEGYATRLDAFVAATDLYLWKLLRLDLGRSEDATKSALRALLAGLIAPTHNARE